MKFDRRSRALLLYVVLPVYVALLVFFVYVSSFHKGKYDLPKARLDEAFVAFAGHGYVLAQETGATGAATPGKVIDEAAAESLVKAYGAVGKRIAVEEPGAVYRAKVVGADELARGGRPGIFAVRSVEIGEGSTGYELEAGTELTDATAARIAEALSGAEAAPQVTVVAATAVAMPENVESPEFTEFLGAGYVLDEMVRVAVGGEEIEKAEGTVLGRELLLTLMEMRDGKVGKEYVKVRGAGPVIGFQWTFVFIVLNFVVLVTFLHGLLWKPVLEVLDKRRETISSDLSKAKESRESAQAILTKYRTTMEGAREERQEIIENGRREGDQERERITGEAKTEAKAMRERARLEIETERRTAEQELVSEVGAYSVELATKILSREVSEGDHRAMVDEFIGSIKTGEGEGP